jgi:hypothetical protein
MNRHPSPTELPAHRLPKVMTAIEMRRHWLDREVTPLSPILDMTVKYAGHWWNLDGTDAWVRATDPNAIALYEATQKRAADALAQLRSRRQH